MRTERRRRKTFRYKVNKEREREFNLNFFFQESFQFDLGEKKGGTFSNYGEVFKLRN
jgi:hypothetical protein